MKILAICGSPHKNGNTYSVLKTIEAEYPDIEFNTLMLNEVDLKQCLGCYGCVRLGEEKCPLEDDRDMIIQEMLEADGVVFPSPVYVNFVSALMKGFLERVGYEGHRPRFYGKFAMVIAVCGMFGAKEANKYMSDIAISFGFDVVSSLELQIATKSEKETKYNHDKIVQAFDMFVERIRSGQTSAPPLSQIIRFYTFKTISESEPEYFKADYQYYKDKAIFPYDGKMPFLRETRGKWAALMALRDFMAHR